MFDLIKLAKYLNFLIIIQQFKCIKKNQIKILVEKIFDINIYILLKNINKIIKKFTFTYLSIKKYIYKK